MYAKAKVSMQSGKTEVFRTFAVAVKQYQPKASCAEHMIYNQCTDR